MFSSVFKSSFFSLILLLFFSFAVLNHAGKIVKVGKLCRQTLDRKFCLEIFNSMPGGAEGKDLVTLGEYTVGVAQANLTGTITLLKSLISNASGPESKGQYQECYSTYTEEAVGVLQEAKGFLKNGNYGGVSLDGSLLISLSSECMDQTKDDESPLVKSNADLMNFGRIIEIIGTLLQNAL